MGFYSMELHKPFKSHGPQGPWRQKSDSVCKGLEGLRGRGGKDLRPLGMGVGREADNRSRLRWSLEMELRAGEEEGRAQEK